MQKETLLQIMREVQIMTTDVAQFIRSEFGKVQKTDIVQKEKNSLVSYVDIQAEKKIVSFLSAILPEAGFVTEEGTIQNNHESKQYKWIIDPLDGTTNFLKGIPIFSISIALQSHDKIILGIVYDVMRDECFHATSGGGSFCNDQPIKISEVMAFDESVIATGFPYHRHTMIDLSQLFAKFLSEVRGVRRMGSAAIDLAYTACGRLDGYYETSLNPWDIAAGILLIEEAGGIVTNFKNEPHRIYDHHIVAANKQIHKEMLDVIERYSES